MLQRLQKPFEKSVNQIFMKKLVSLYITTFNLSVTLDKIFSLISVF